NRRVDDLHRRAAGGKRDALSRAGDRRRAARSLQRDDVRRDRRGDEPRLRSAVAGDRRPQVRGDRGQGARLTTSLAVLSKIARDNRQEACMPKTPDYFAGKTIII